MKRISSYLKFGFLVLLSLTPVIWFIGRNNVLVNGVDTNFPLNPAIWFTRRLFVWSSIPNAGVDFSSSVSGLFFHFVQLVPYTLGFSLQRVELFSFVFWFSLIILSSYMLARLLFPLKSVAQILFVVFYSFNIYMFNSWENVKVSNLSLIAGIPLAISLLLMFRKKAISFGLLTFLSLFVAIVISGTGINPSYFISFFLVIFLFFLGSLLTEGNRKNLIIGFLTISGIIFLVNSFWILPTFNFIFKNIPTQGSLGKIGFNNWVDSLSENTSIFNIMRLQGAWDWYTLDSSTGLPVYIPYAVRYFYSLPFLIFSITPAALSIISLFFRDRKNKNLYLSFGTMLIVGVFLGVGTHTPTGAIFGFLMSHVPFFNLFRSPWYIFTPLVTLSYAGLIGILFSKSYKISFFKIRIINIILPLFGVILIVGNLIYSYPLITGKIFRPSRPDGFYINFPDYVFKAGDWLSKYKGGRIISYPDDEIENFDWKYRGVESILELLANQDVLFSPLNDTTAPISLLTKQFYRNLKRGEIDSMKSIAAKLNVGLIFNKSDQFSLSIPLPQEVKSMPSNKFGKWEFYELPGNNTLAKIYSPKNLIYSYPYSESSTIVSALGANDQVINPDDQVVKSIPLIANYSGDAILAKNLQLNDYLDFANSNSKLSNRLVTRDFSKVDFNFNIESDGTYEPQLERYHVEDFGINPTGDINVILNGKIESWSVERVTNSYIVFKPREFKKGKYTASIKLDNRNLIVGGDFESGEKFIRGGYGEGTANYGIVEDQTGKFLSLFNLGKAEESAEFKVTGFDPYFPYYSEFRYKQIYGNNGQALAEQKTSTTLVKAQTERLPNYPEWQNFSFYYQPVETASEMNMFLLAPYTKDPLGTKVFYDDLVVRKVFTNNFLLIKKNQESLTSPQIDYKKNSPVSYVGNVNGASGPHILVFSENYSTNWEIKITDMNGKLLNIPGKHFTINLYANAWYFEKTPASYKFEIYYKPQRLYNIGVLTSFSTFVISVGYIIWRKTIKIKR